LESFKKERGNAFYTDKYFEEKNFMRATRSDIGRRHPKKGRKEKCSAPQKALPRNDFQETSEKRSERR